MSTIDLIILNLYAAAMSIQVFGNNTTPIRKRLLVIALTEVNAEETKCYKEALIAHYARVLQL
mgnify:CR=1 FL=1